MIEKNSLKELEEFESCREAARRIIELKATSSTNEISISSNIRLTAKGDRKSAYGYFWKFSEEAGE